MDHDDGTDDDGGHSIHAHNVPGTKIKVFHELYQVSLTATPSARAVALASFYVRGNLGFKR